MKRPLQTIWYIAKLYRDPDVTWDGPFDTKAEAERALIERYDDEKTFAVVKTTYTVVRRGKNQPRGT